jgi:hypothetical protein
MFNAYYTNFPNYTTSGWVDADWSQSLVVVNKNNDVTSQELYYPTGYFLRDNSTKHRGAASIKLNTRTANPTSFPDIVIPAVDGQSITIKGFLRKNSSYGSSTRPYVTLTGLGITPQVFTMPDTADTWEAFTLSVTPSAGYDGNLRLVFTGQSGNAAGECWLDGLAYIPFNGYVDHYGYLLDPANNARTADPVIQLSESSVAALTGIAVVSGVVTLTEDHSVRELYDWLQWYRAENQSGRLMSSGDGLVFSLSAALVLDGCRLTGTGTINMGGNSLTLTGTTASGVVINHVSGSYVSISVAGYNTGARIQIYDVGGGVELYNSVPAGSTLSLNANWSADRTIRVRMARVNGTDADATIEAFGTLSSTGASFLLSPVADVVYEGNAIDGATVTEFVADFPNVQIDLSDLDGITTPQRGYAWYMYNQMTADGLRYYHGAMAAEDASNYRINVDVADIKIQNVSASPCVISGARIYRSDGSSIFAVGNGPIQSDPGKAYIAGADDIPGAVAAEVLAAAQAAPIHADLRMVNGQIIDGSGTEADPWGPA